jgi:hypothetical protein
MASKIKIRRSQTTGQALPAGVAGDYGTIGVNLIDRKVFVLDSIGQPVVVADRIADFSASKAYASGDFVINGSSFLRANTAISPGAFNPAQWTSIGGGNASGAILMVPDTTTRNTIDLTGRPTYKGLVIKGDPAQTANLFEVPGTAAGDTRAATIDATGFPVDRFATNIFRVSQASHPFLYRGQPAAFVGGVWVLADADVPERVAIAVVEQRIDDNTFVLRTGGKITQLQAAAFMAGITAGTVYYVSDTAGRLSDTPSASRPDPVLLTISTTEAIVFVGVGTGATDFVRKIGDTMTGPLTMAGVNEIRFDGTANALFKQTAVPGIQVKVSNVVAARFDDAGVTAGYAQTVMTREKADGRYLLLTGGTLTGALQVPAGTAAAPSLAIGAANMGFYQGSGGTIIASVAGAAVGRISAGTATTDALDIMSRGKGDARYLQLSGGTLTGMLTLSADPTVALHAATKSYVDDGVAGRLTQAQGDARYALRTLTLTGGTGIATIGNLTANRTVALDLAYTDDRYLRINEGKASSHDVTGRLNIYSTSSSGIVLRMYGTSDNVVGTMTTGGDLTVSGALSASGNEITMRHTGSNALLNNSGAGGLYIQFNGTNTFFFARDGEMNSDSSIPTRISGDARWAAKAPGVGTMGSYALLRCTDGAVIIKPGDVVPGSRLAYATSDGRVDHPGEWPLTRPPGNWQAMGLASSYAGGNTADVTTLFVRVPA